MDTRRHLGAVGSILIASATGCAMNALPAPTSETTGQIQVAVPASPADVASIHVVVTGDFATPIEADLDPQPAHAWSGMVLDIPPGAARTVTAEGFDGAMNNTFEAIENNVTVFAGKLTNIELTMKPRANGPFPITNTPPHLIALIHPESILSSQTAMLSATANDPDDNTQLKYTWSVLSGGGSFSSDTQDNQTPGVSVSTMYIPGSSASGFAVLEVSVTDGTVTTSTTFPIAFAASVAPNLRADVLSDQTI